MKLTILGSGCPSVDLERHGPSALIDCGKGAKILIDCGSGVTQRLLEHGVTGRRNFSQICRGGARNKDERNERNILTLGRKSTFAPR